MKPTKQQEKAVELSKTEKMLKLVACAGAGKTSTLKLIAGANNAKSIYLAFNKVTAEEAREGFPSHVECATTHSVAYRKFGVILQSKLTRPKGKYVNVANTGSEIARYYAIDDVYDFSMERILTANAVGLLVKESVQRYEQSADINLSMDHVMSKEVEKFSKAAPKLPSTILKHARLFWKDRINKDSIVMASHDTYLKLFQLSKPVLPYDIIYVDEAQDSSPCVLDIVLNQKDTAKIIFVGDPRQAIYGWRGAVNAMEMVYCVEAPLSQSFRYGQGIADVATAVLQGAMVITGRDDIQCEIGYQVVDRTKPHMFLFRTNAMLLIEAVTAIDKGEKVKVEVDTRDFVKLLQSSLALYRKEMKEVKHETILPYATWNALVEDSGESGEIKRIVSIVEGSQADHYIAVLEDYQAPADAIATYTTCHKAKGRESEQVILASDFPSNYVKGEWKGLIRAEENLLYVAVTRAMRVLEINSTLAEILDKNRMKYKEENQWADAEEEHAFIAQNYDRLAAKAEEIGVVLEAVGYDISKIEGYSKSLHVCEEVMQGEMAIEAMHREMGWTQ